MVEKREAQCIVGPILTVLILVGPPRALEQRWAIDQPNRQGGVGRAGRDQTQRPRAHEIFEFEPHRFIRSGLDCPGIAGHQELHINTKGRERHRERGAHVRKAAGFGEGIDLG